MMNTCPDQGRWRHYLDANLPAAEQAALAAHLTTCAPCQQTVAVLQPAADFRQQALATLTVPPDALATHHAWRRLQTRLSEQPPRLSLQERIATMLTSLTSRTARLALSGALASLAVALLLALTPAGSLALQALQVFRIQTFKAITFEVDPTAMPKIGERKPQDPRAKPSPEERDQWRQRLEKELAALGVKIETTITDKTGREVADLAAARTAGNGIALQAISSLPSALQSTTAKVYVAEPTKSTATVDLVKLRQALKDHLKDRPKDGSGFDPDRLPGINPNATSISGTVQTAFAVVQVYGEGEQAMVFAQGASPVLTLSEGIDVAAIRDALVAMPVVSKTTRTQLQSIRDDEWSRTLIIPVPQGTIVRDVTIGGVLGVGGVPGLLLVEKDGQGGVVMWQKGGTLYAVAGNYGQDALLAAANSAK